MFIQPNTRLLIIDDRDEDMLFLLVMSLKSKFPTATIDYVNGFRGLEEKIMHGNYHIVLLDQDLKNFGYHHLFHNKGEKMIPFIREKSPTSKIIGISDRNNHILLQAGAHDCVPKDDILSFFSTKPIEELLVA